MIEWGEDQEYHMMVIGDLETHTWLTELGVNKRQTIEAIQLFWQQYMPTSEWHYQGLTMSIGPHEVATTARRVLLKADYDWSIDEPRRS